MNRAERRRLFREARRHAAGYPPCPYCEQQAGVLVDICTEGCCEPRQLCAGCMFPLAAGPASAT